MDDNVIVDCFVIIIIVTYNIITCSATVGNSENQNQNFTFMQISIWKFYVGLMHNMTRTSLCYLLGIVPNKAVNSFE